jgi:hypothetical protein
MGLCRAGLYALGYFLAVEDSFTEGHRYGFTELEVFRQYAFLTTHALGLLIYIAGLSLAARYESTEHPPHGMVLLSRAMLFLPLAAMSAWWMIYYPIPSLIGLIPFAIWLTISLTRFRRPVPVFVSALLAGIPLIDFIAALPIASSGLLPDQLLSDNSLMLATVIVPLAAFALGRLLQRVAPAT